MSTTSQPVEFDRTEFNRLEFSRVAKLVHWWIAGMLVLQFVLAKLAERAEIAGSQVQQLALLANHKSVGITILGVAIFRLAWRTYKPPPPALPMPDWQRLAAQVSHLSLYGLLFLMPITGWLMSSASAYSVSWFNLVQLPDVVEPNEALKGTLEQIHGILAKLLFAIAALHIAAGLKHAFVDKDGALRRISSSTSLAIFVVVVVGGYFSLSDVRTERVNPIVPTATTEPVAAPPATTQQNTTLPLWDIDYSTSNIRFIGDQAGADFSGEWPEWSAELRFSPDSPATGVFDVTVDVTSVDTGDQERDDTIVDADWFDADNHPQAFYRATTFSAAPDGVFVAEGAVVIKNLTTPVPLMFTLSTDGDRYTLNGTATLDRLQLQVGVGEWLDTEWVGQFVDVSVHVEAIVSQEEQPREAQQ